MPDVKRIMLAILLVAAVVGTWWLARNLTAAPETFDGRSRHDPDYTVENFVTTAMDERGHRQYTLTAVRMVHYGDDESAEFDRPHLVKYNPDAPPVHTRAAHGWMPKDGDVIVMTGDVRVTRARDARSPGGTMRFDRMRVQLDK